MKKISLLFVLAIYCLSGSAQRMSVPERAALRLKEDSMKNYALQIVQGINTSDRFKADSLFTRTLMRGLVLKHSFQYQFDSLPTISILMAPDSSFRIFTWQLAISENMVRHHGVIQMRTPDGSLKRYPLIDKTVITSHLHDTVANNFGWIGAIYYKIILKKENGRNYYTLLGFDANNIRSDRKIIEVLSFNNDEPIFGGRYFSFAANEPQSKTPISRYVMEYKKDAGPRLSYDPELDMIIVEHLVSESGEPNKKFTLVGDGDYEGFKWQGGRWVHIEKVFNYVTPLGQEPVPNPIRDNGGNLMDNKIGDADDTKPAPAAKPKKKGKE